MAKLVSNPLYLTPTALRVVEEILNATVSRIGDNKDVVWALNCGLDTMEYAIASMSDD